MPDVSSFYLRLSIELIEVMHIEQKNTTHIMSVKKTRFGTVSITLFHFFFLILQYGQEITHTYYIITVISYITANLSTERIHTMRGHLHTHTRH